MVKITIIGASSGFGEWLAKYILDHFQEKIDLTITGTDQEKTSRVANTLGCSFSLDNIEAVKNADITIFAVPIAYTEKIIKEVCPHLKSGSMVLDVTSIKQFPSIAMQKSVSNDILIVPTHPMFGPHVSTIASQIFVLTPEEEVKKDQRYIFLKNFLESEGAKVIEASPKKHDKMMAVVQGLTHFDMFVLGETIKRLGIDIQKSMDFVSPIYKIMISSVARYMNQNPKLYGDIQMYNTEVLEVHKVFMEATNDFNNFVKQKDEESFIKTISKTQKYFGKNSLEGQKYTDKIIHMISKQTEKIEQSIGKDIEILNIYSEKKIKGTLKEFKNNTLSFTNKEKYHIDEWEIL